MARLSVVGHFCLSCVVGRGALLVTYRLPVRLANSTSVSGSFGIVSGRVLGLLMRFFFFPPPLACPRAILREFGLRQAILCGKDRKNDTLSSTEGPNSSIKRPRGALPYCGKHLWKQNLRPNGL